jgi:hypothetical protein
VWIYVSTPPYLFMALCVIYHRDDFFTDHKIWKHFQVPPTCAVCPHHCSASRLPNCWKDVAGDTVSSLNGMSAVANVRPLLIRTASKLLSTCVSCASFLLSLQRPDRLWAPSSLLYSGLKRQGRKASDMVKEGGTIPPLPNMSISYFYIYKNVSVRLSVTANLRK